jgi:hypothetical protein
MYQQLNCSLESANDTLESAVSIPATLPVLCDMQQWYRLAAKARQEMCLLAGCSAADSNLGDLPGTKYSMRQHNAETSCDTCLHLSTRLHDDKKT